MGFFLRGMLDLLCPSSIFVPSFNLNALSIVFFHCHVPSVLVLIYKVIFSFISHSFLEFCHHISDFYNSNLSYSFMFYFNLLICFLLL